MNPTASLSKVKCSKLDEVQEALIEPFPEEVIKVIDDTGHRYIPAIWIKQRMLSVLGVDGFDVCYSTIQHHDEGWITVCCTITVDFSIWGGRRKSVNQSDGIRVARHSKGDKAGKVVDLGDSYKSLKSGAFVKAAQELGVGLYLALETESKGSKAPLSHGNSGRNNPATGKQKKAVSSMERKIGFNSQLKRKLFEQLFPKEEVETALSQPTFGHMDRYLRTLKPVCDIYDLVQSHSESKDDYFAKLNGVLRELGAMFNIELRSLVSLLTLADNQTVSWVKDYLKKQLKKSFYWRNYNEIRNENVCIN